MLRLVHLELLELRELLEAQDLLDKMVVLGFMFKVHLHLSG
jgi:hypothetical protein